MNVRWQRVLGKIFLFIVCCSLAISPLEAKKHKKAKAPSIVQSSIVICAETGAILHQSNADTKTYPASLTKMMTLYLTFKALKENRLKLFQKLPISQHASHQQPSKLGLKQGSTITVQEAILALVTKSANDAAVALAETLGGGSELHFAHLMTQQAVKLGMTQTVFKNASGLPHKGQTTTARDMATLSQSLYKHFPKEFKYFKEKHFAYKGQVHRNHNHLLGKVPGVDGIKTGFINASGFNLAASMVRNDRRIIAVVMGGSSIKSRDTKMKNLLEATFSNFKALPVVQPQICYASTIGDLIHSLGPTQAHAASFPVSSKQSLQNLPYESLDHLIEDIQIDDF